MTDRELKETYAHMYKRITETVNRYPGNVSRDVQEKMLQTRIIRRCGLVWEACSQSRVQYMAG